MYKIYINGTLLLLMKSSNLEKFNGLEENMLASKYSGHKKSLLNHIDLLEKSKVYDLVVLHSDQFKQMKQDFNNLFQIEEAAGGIVINEFGELLAIFRRGLWDLPKGKLEAGETKKQAALREVKEETGVKNLKLSEYSKTTFHVFKRKVGTRVLKKVKWYEMKAKKQPLSPQKKEGIQKAEWVSFKTFLKKKDKTFINIHNLVRTFCDETDFMRL